MRRSALVFLVLLCMFCSASPADKPTPRVPGQMGYCVVVTDPNGVLIGTVNVPLHKPNPANLDEFRSSLKNAINLIGRTTNRPDVIEASGTVELVDNPIPPLHKPRPPRTNGPETIRKKKGDPCSTTCFCATLNYNPIASEPPQTEAGGITCGGPCSNCERCIVTC